MRRRRVVRVARQCVCVCARETKLEVVGRHERLTFDLHDVRDTRVSYVCKK